MRMALSGFAPPPMALVIASASMTLAIAACTSTTLRADVRRIDVAEGVYLRLPAADELTGSFDATQVISAKYEGGTRTFEAHIEARPGKIAIVGLNTIGVTLFSIRYDGTDLVASGVAEAQVVNAEYVLADVLLSHWDADWLGRRLEGATLKTSTGARSVMRGDETVVGIVYESGAPWSGVARLENHERGYSLRIDNIAFESR